MYDVFGECLNVCVKRLERDKMNSPEEMAKYYKKLDISIAVLKMFRFFKDVTLDSECNEDGNHEIILTCEKDFYNSLKVNGKLYFSKERPYLKINTNYCLISIDGNIFTTDDRDECVKVHLSQRQYLLKKLIGN